MLDQSGGGGGGFTPGRLVISKFKQVYISTTGMGRQNELVTGIPLILEDDITISLSSTFNPLMQSSDSGIQKALTLLGGVFRDRTRGAGFSGQFDWQGYQLWAGTDPISFTLNFSFYVGISQGEHTAKREVYEPIIALAKLPLPRAGFGGNLTPPGPSISTLFSGRNAGKTTKGIITSIRIANILAFSTVIVKRAEPTFASEFDKDGYPIWGKISLEIETVHTATQQLLDFDEMGRGGALDKEMDYWEGGGE